MSLRCSSNLYGAPILTQYEGYKLPHKRKLNIDSDARLLDNRLLVRVRKFEPIGHFDDQINIPSWLKDESLELYCPHARQMFSHQEQLSNETIEAGKLLCADPGKRTGFVHKRYLCKYCPTETVIEIVRRED
ncbi:hypothetical protein E8E13_000338 [Curvularia kusanoi]|uniref:Uncharacterized protein n=1 Tax=Curvularia kusanoi TaxID=90978 RepID=A0A9P4TI67_CURKU|nr:hypothetical protein E8E13_000338 [Curvularia kusanoi]